MAKCGRPQNPNFYQSFRSLFSVLCAKRQHSTQYLVINSITEVSESFVVKFNLTVIDLMSIVHMDKIWVKTTKKF